MNLKQPGEAKPGGLLELIHRHVDTLPQVVDWRAELTVGRIDIRNRPPPAPVPGKPPPSQAEGSQPLDVHIPIQVRRCSFARVVSPAPCERPLWALIWPAELPEDCC